MQSKIMKLPEVIVACGLSRSSIYAFVLRGKFPPPINLGARAVGWLESEINDWIAGRAESRHLPVKREA